MGKLANVDEMGEAELGRVGPRILAMETSGRVGCVAVARGGKLLQERRLTQGMRHAVELMPMVREMVAEQGWKPGEIEQVYVSTGPGSFTGLRIGIAVARGLAQAAGCKLVGVPTLDVLAKNAPATVENLVVALDAKRGQVFAARYERRGGELVRTAGPALVDPAEFVRQTTKPVAVLGEGVEYHRAALRAGVEREEDFSEIEKELWAGSAAAVHAIGWEMARRGEFVERDRLVPVYIRLAEAEELWNKRNAEKAV